MALAKGLVPSLLSQAAARAAEPLAHITRTLVQLEVIDHDVGQTALSNYLKNCLAKSKGISGPSYNPANGSHTLHRHIAAAVPVASLLKVRGKELLSALHRTREEPEAAPSYTELQASADASAAAARREQQRSSQLRAQVKTLQEVSVNAVRKEAEREAKEKSDATVQRVRASAERQVAAAQAGAEDAKENAATRAEAAYGEQLAQAQQAAKAADKAKRKAEKEKQAAETKLQDERKKGRQLRAELQGAQRELADVSMQLESQFEESESDEDGSDEEMEVAMTGEDADGPWYVCCVYAHIRLTLSSRHTHAKRVSCRSGCLN